MSGGTGSSVSADRAFLVTRWPDEPEGGIEVKLRNVDFQTHAEDGPMQHRKSLGERARADTQLRADSLPPSSPLLIMEWGSSRSSEAVPLLGLPAEVGFWSAGPLHRGQPCPGHQEPSGCAVSH